VTREAERERLRRKRAELEAVDAQGERRKRMVQLGAGAVLLAAVLVAVLIAVSQSGEDSGGSAENVRGAAEVGRELRGLPQDGTVLGSPDAPVTVAEFGDLQCPACKQYAEQVVPDLIDGPVRGGRAALDFRNWVILSPLDGDSGEAARAALAAGEQDRLWHFVTLFYRNQGFEGSGYVTDDFMRAIAEAAGVPDLERWEEDRGDERWEEVLADVDAQAQRLGFTGTPSFSVRGPRRTLSLGTPGSVGEIEQAIAQAG
jgi:protein-disulfide isomerase